MHNRAPQLILQTYPEAIKKVEQDFGLHRTTYTPAKIMQEHVRQLIADNLRGSDATYAIRALKDLQQMLEHEIILLEFFAVNPRGEQ